jgi:hypothetical protein
MPENVTAPRRPRKEGTLTMRLTTATRQKLERRAMDAGRSVSEISERLIEEALAGHATAESLLGGVAAAPVIRDFIRVARHVEETIGRPDEDGTARDALREAWRLIVQQCLPNTPASPRERIVEATRDLAIDQIRDLRDRLAKLHADTPDQATTAAYTAEAPQRDELGGLLRAPQPLGSFLPPMLSGGDSPKSLARFLDEAAANLAPLESLAGKMRPVLAQFAETPSDLQAEARATLSAIDQFINAFEANLFARADAFRKGRAIVSMETRRMYDDAARGLIAADDRATA